MNTTMVENKTTSMGWLGGWAIASAIGLIVGMGGTLMLLWSISEGVASSIGENVGTVVFGVAFGLGLGLVLGMAQWIVLRLRGESNMRCWAQPFWVE